MEKREIGTVITALAPSVILTIYVLLSRSIALYGRAGETFFPLLVLDLVAHAGIGLAAIVIAVTFLPRVDFGVCSNLLFSCPAQAGLILSVYGAAYLAGGKG